MAESEVHRTMKGIVRRELEEGGFAVLEEPLFSPSRRVHWANYRPDLIGYLNTGGREELVIVECETHPSPKRFRRKNFGSLWFQPHLLCQGRIRLVLAVPQGTLPAVDMKLRNQWEIWVLGRSGPMCKFDALSGDETAIKRDAQTCAATVP